ncbi:MAG: hypothetical protein AB7F74_23600 [Parvibaculaceae bacterium]
MTIEQLMRETFYSRAHWTPEASAYVARHRIDMAAVNAFAGLLAVIPCDFAGNGTFDFAEFGGTPAVVIEVYAEDDETTVDLVAWPLDRPESFATMLGSDALGMARVFNPATWAFGHVLNVFRTPLAWLQAGCDGCAVLDHRNVAGWLGKALGPIQAEDIAHARQIDAWLNPKFDKRNILVPREERKAAA